MGSGSTTARSRRPAVPTTLGPPADGPRGQLGLGLELEPASPAGRPVTLRPGIVHIPGWLSASSQRRLVAAVRRWALPPAGLRHPRMPSGHLMTVQSVCLGWHWSPYAYSRTADDTDGAPVTPMPRNLVALAKRAVADTGFDDTGLDDTGFDDTGFDDGAGAGFAPDAAIINYYADEAHLGLHQDGEEPAAAPVVTISLGDVCTFRFAGVDRRTGPFTDVELHSGDLLVFGGPSRRVFHGVPKVRPGTAPAGLGLPPGRVSITVRETGLSTSIEVPVPSTPWRPSSRSGT